MKPKEVIAVREGQRLQVRRPQVHRLAGHLAAHDDPGARASTRSCSRRASASTARRSAAGSRSTRATCSMTPGRRHGADRSVLRAADAQPDLQHLRPGHRPALRPRPALHRAEGRELPRSRRASPTPRSSGPRPSSSSSTPSATRARRAAPSTSSTRDEAAWNTRQGGPEPRLQGAPQGGLLPRPADRHARRSAPGHHDDAHGERHRGRGRPPRGRARPGSARSG